MCTVVQKLLMLCGGQTAITFDVNACWTWLLWAHRYFGNAVISMYKTPKSVCTIKNTKVMMDGFMARIRRSVEGQKYGFSIISSELCNQWKNWRYWRLQWSYAEYSSVSNVVYWPVDPTISPFDRFSGSREFWVKICENMSKIRKIVTRDLGVGWER